jgi:Leucine-rich repeat (LRR) protein
MIKIQRLVFLLRDKPGHVDGSNFDDETLVDVPKNTVFLSLENANVSDLGIELLPDLPHLRCIDLDGTHITDKGMKRIAEFRNLEEIWIEGTQVSDVGLSVLYPLENLKFISILDCEHISKEGIERLRAAVPGVEVH